MININQEIMVACLSKAYHDIEFILNNRDYNDVEEFIQDTMSKDEKIIKIKDKSIEITTLHMFIIAMLCHIENDKLSLRRLYYYQLYVLADAFCYSKPIDQCTLNEIVDEIIKEKGEQ